MSNWRLNADALGIDHNVFWLAARSAVDPQTYFLAYRGMSGWYSLMTQPPMDTSLPLNGFIGAPAYLFSSFPGYLLVEPD